MLNNFDNIYLQKCSFLKLRFTYILSNNTKPYKFDYLLRFFNFDEDIKITIKDFLLSVLVNIIAPFLYLQNESVKWSSVSIIYESNLKNQNNLYLIPLKNVKGQVSANYLKDTDLKVFLRFQNNPRPTILKIRGISDSIDEEEDVVEKHLKALEKAFTDVFLVENTAVSYHYIHPQTVSVLSKLRKNRSNKSNLNVDSRYRRPILALTDL